jgi:membrane protease YdiL (CAAX protease family)
LLQPGASIEKNSKIICPSAAFKPADGRKEICIVLNYFEGEELKEEKMTVQSVQPVDRNLSVMQTVKTKILTTLEILLVFAVLIALRVYFRSASIVQWENQNLGWSYTMMFLFLGIITVVMLLTRRSWAEYGVSITNWQTNLDIGFKAYLIRILPAVGALFGPAWLGLRLDELGRGMFAVPLWVIAVALIIWVLNRQKEVKSGRGNLIATLLFLLVPIGLALIMGKVSVVIISTVIWQFIFSGFGEEFIFRGYFQSRMNQAFGRPMHLFGVQFGAGLFIASLLFGLLHAFNGYDPAIGITSLAWGSAIGSTVAGLFFGVLREKTGNLVAPGIAHGLPDAVGEPMKIIFGWV